MTIKEVNDFIAENGLRIEVAKEGAEEYRYKIYRHGKLILEDLTFESKADLLEYSPQEIIAQRGDLEMLKEHYQQRIKIKPPKSLFFVDYDREPDNKNVIDIRNYRR